MLLSISFFLTGTGQAQNLNLAPDCSQATASKSSIWPPNHSFVPIEILGVNDPDNDSIDISIQCIFQDEELNTTGDGNTEYDGEGIDASTASVRSERSGNENGRVYHIDYIATDSNGAKCGGEVLVSVPHSKNKEAVDDGRLYASVPSSNVCGQHDINNPPIIYSSPVLSGNTWTSYQYDVDGHDPDQDVLLYELLASPDGMEIDPSSGLITWDSLQPGDFSVQVMVSDGRGGTAEQSYELFINGPPEITSQPLTLHQIGSPYQYQVTAQDPNNDTLTYELTSAPGGMTINSSSGLITWDNPIPGEYPVTILVQDGRGGQAQQTYSLFINGPPEITSQPPTLHQTGSPYQYQVTAQDPNNDTLTYELTSAPGGMTINSSNGLITWDNPVPGEYPVTIHVQDGRGGEAQQTYSLFINGPPEITSQPSTEHEAETLYQYQVTAQDPNSDTLTFSLTQKPDGMAINNSTGLITWTPTADQIGDYSVTVQADDGHGGTASQSWTINVKSSNNPPEITNTPPPQGATGLLYQYQVEATDPDNDTLTYSLLQSPDDMTIDSETGTISWTPTEEQLGTQKLALKVEDGKGGEDAQVADVEIIVQSGVDLEPITLEATTSINTQTLLLEGTVDVEIRNNGQGYFGAGYQVILFEDSNHNQTYDADDKIISTYHFEGEHNGGDTVPVSFEISTQVLFRDNLIYAYVDSSEQVDEYVETNNIIHSQISCEYIPPVGSFDPVIEWAWSTSENYPGSNHVMSAPVVANLNDDNGDGVINTDDIPDIIFHTYSGNSYNNDGVIRAISGDGSGELFTIMDYRTRPGSNLAVGDIDNDGLVEIVAVDQRGYNSSGVIAFENDGTFKWKSDYVAGGYFNIHYLSIADLDADGSPEIIFNRAILNNDGTTKWLGKNTYEAIAVDLNLDGKQEVVLGNSAYDSAGNLLWENDAITSYGYMAAANFDDDPYPEIVFVGGGYVYLLEHTGEVIWGPIDLPPEGLNRDHGGPPTIADFDNDGEPEIGIAGGYRYVVFEADGSVKWAQPTQDKTSSRTGSSVFDFDGDGSAEVVYGDEKYFRIYRGTDGKVLYIRGVGSLTLLELPVVVDVDNDNNAEIIVVSNNSSTAAIQVFGDANDTWVNTRKIWNQHAYSITNVNDDGTIPRVVSNNWETFNNFRQNQMLNPFGCQDLSASYLRADQANMPDSITLTARIGNSGALHIADNINVAFYNGDPESGGILLGTTTITERIVPGQYFDVSIEWQNPLQELTAIYVRADDDGTGKGRISESDEENNTAHFSIIPGNNQPIADAGKDQTVFKDTTVTLDGGNSSDPDGDPITYQWTIIESPENSAAALADPTAVTTTFVADEIGSYTIQLVVNDGIQDSGVSTVKITVSKVIQVPGVVGMTQTEANFTLDASSLTTGEITTEYSQTVKAGIIISQSPEAGTNVTSSTRVDLVVSAGIQMVTVPDVTGMTREEAENALSAAGLITGEVTEHYITVQPAGHVYQQSPSGGTLAIGGTGVDLTVSLGPWTGEDTTPPQVKVSVSPGTINVGNQVTITTWEADDAGLAGNTLTVDGQQVTLTGDTATYTATSPGFLKVEFTATDTAGHSSTATTFFRVVDPDDNTPPHVSLDEEKCVDITDRYSITGSISDEDEVFYALFYREQGTSQWQYLADGIGNPIKGELGVFDPTTKKNGVYQIGLYGEDLNGNYNVAIGCVVADENLKLGHVNISLNDLEQPGPGFPLSLERVYDTRTTTGDFGPGWNLSSSEVAVQPTISLGYNWGQEAGGSMFTTYYLIEKQRHDLVVRLPDDETLKFRMDVTPKSSLLYPIENHSTLTVNYKALGDTQATVEALDASSHVMLVENSLRIWGTDLYEPTRFRITLKDGTQYIVSTTKGLESMIDVYGNSVSYSENGISHSSGASISFERGTDNRIEKITDQLGRTIEYYYDADGMLEKVIQKGTEPLAMRTISNLAYASAGFEQPVLKTIKAPDGTELGSFEYTDGKVTALIDADGNRIIYGYDLDNHTQEITDRLGNTTVYEYDSSGNVTRKSDPLGYVTEWTYDDNGNKLTETDPLDHTSTYTYDENNNQLTETDPLGNTTTYTYDESNKVLTITDPKGHVTTNTYDANHELTSTTDALGNTTGYSYDASGNLSAMTDALGQTTSYTYDAYGNKLTETDPLGNTANYTYDGYGNELTRTTTRTSDSGPLTMTTTMVYDSRNRLIKTIDPDGNQTQIEYNQLGKKSADIDEDGNRTEYEYDANSNLTLVSYSDGTTQATDYDAEGNQVSVTNRSGHTTSYEYDELKHLTVTNYPDSAQSENIYDQAGRLVQTVDERGNSTDFDFDAAGRRSSVTDALGNQTFYGYDNAGNQTSVTDANGNTTSYTYDGANRQIQTTFADSTSVTTTYDQVGRKTAKTDQNGRTTSFEYDPLGRLTTVVDAKGGQTSYSYDEVGNKLTQTDAEGRVTRWSYDNEGRVISHTLPLGQEERFTYDAKGNQESHTDFNGETTNYSYSTCCGRLLQKLFPDGSTEDYTYTGTGQVESVTNHLGTASYLYDERDRLLQVNHPDGTYISYTYDPAGNRTAVSTPSGDSVFTYDQLNRLSTVADLDGGITSYSYDPVGNRASVTLPNNTSTHYTYDSLNRLVLLENIGSDNSILSSYNYTLGPAGNRLRVDEAGGRSVGYSYDELYRLVEEQISDPVSGSKSISYTYDKVGNRLTKTEDGVVTDYSYDDNDRLISDSDASYSYDENGNTIQKDGTDGVITYGYDYQDKLVEVNTPSEAIEYEYNHSGIRVAKRVNGVETRYLIDSNRPYAQVLEEYEDNNLSAIYIYGDDLVSQDRGSWSYYLYDGQLSTRQLADHSGTVTDRYTYDAFGNLLEQDGNTENNFLYTGEQFDPNVGFYYLRARYYDQSSSRFLGMDPYGGRMYEPMTLHRYQYAGANPITNMDPSGEMSIGSVMASIAIVGTLNSIATTSYANVKGPRKLHPEEQTIAYKIFEKSVIYDRVRVDVNGNFDGGAYVWGNTITFSKNEEYEKYRFLKRYKALLLHEMTHVWRYQNFGWGYVTECLSEIATEGKGKEDGAYKVHYDPDKAFIDYDCEEQAEIVRDYYLGESKYMPLIHELRMYRP